MKIQQLILFLKKPLVYHHITLGGHSCTRGSPLELTSSIGRKETKPGSNGACQASKKASSTARTLRPGGTISSFRIALKGWRMPMKDILLPVLLPWNTHEGGHTVMFPSNKFNIYSDFFKFKCTQTNPLILHTCTAAQRRNKSPVLNTRNSNENRVLRGRMSVMKWQAITRVWTHLSKGNFSCFATRGS